MSSQHPFRHMRLTLRLVQAQVQLLLAVEGMDWSQNDYAFFFAASEMWRHEVNPTYTRMIGIVGGWLRFYRKLIDKLPFGEFRTNIETEWEKVSEEYKGLLEVQPSK